MRITIGILIAPLVFVVAWSLPLIEHSAFYRWVGINVIFAYLTFLVMAGLSHMVLSKLKWHKLWQYCSVMFVITLFIYLLVKFGALSTYESLYYTQTQVIENGEITKAGYLLELKSSLYGSALASVSMCLFWFVSVFKREPLESNV